MNWEQSTFMDWSEGRVQLEIPGRLQTMVDRKKAVEYNGWNFVLIVITKTRTQI